MPSKRVNETEDAYRERKQTANRAYYHVRKLRVLLTAEQRRELHSTVQRRVQAEKRRIAADTRSDAHKAELRRLILKVLDAKGALCAREIRLRLPDAYRPGVVAMLRVMRNDGTLRAETLWQKGTPYNVYKVLPKAPDNPWLGLLVH